MKKKSNRRKFINKSLVTLSGASLLTSCISNVDEKKSKDININFNKNCTTDCLAIPNTIINQCNKSFESNKKILLSPWLSKTTIHRLSFQSSGIIENLPIEGREKYLEYHRKNIFKS